MSGTGKRANVLLWQVMLMWYFDAWEWGSASKLLDRFF
jgi:hypothetical protein